MSVGGLRPLAKFQFPWKHLRGQGRKGAGLVGRKYDSMEPGEGLALSNFLVGMLGVDTWKAGAHPRGRDRQTYSSQRAGSAAEQGKTLRLTTSIPFNKTWKVYDRRREG